MPEIVARIHKLTQDLLDLNAELEQELAGFAVDRSSALFSEYGLLMAFKGILDHSRHLVWPFVLGAEQKAERNIGVVMQSYRIDRIRQMVASLQQDREGAPEVTRLFLAELHAMTGDEHVPPECTPPA